MEGVDLDTTPAGSAAGLLTLLAMRGVGTRSAERIAARCGVLAEVKSASARDLAGIPAAALATFRDERAWDAAAAQAAATLSQAESLGVRVVPVTGSEYPELLRAIPDRPPVLFVRGKLRPSRRAVACVGTREPSKFGEEVARRVAGFVAERGYSIVSGLALGVDTLAHEAALDAKGHTVAVLANGLEAVYPKKNAGLAARILEAGGALVSEQPFGAPAIPRNLVARDRLQSGMSLATVVMQTDVAGGSMHTVRFTLIQGRLLLAPVPAGEHSAEPKSQGILAMTQKDGLQFARLVRAEGEYEELLRREFATCPVGIPIHGRDDYDAVLRLLESATDRAPGEVARVRPQLALV
ncbi:MAG TPA: DNA-processing protein DprA [Anaeromyxobacteraceae bacterium]|nr:DNA-processing protein DprA [Anaeromyxobacteraceae bacterium]